MLGSRLWRYSVSAGPALLWGVASLSPPAAADAAPARTPREGGSPTDGLVPPVSTGWNSNWDWLQGNPKYGACRAGRRSVILVRHGQYVYAEDDADRKLTALGREQATMTGKRLAEMLKLQEGKEHKADGSTTLDVAVHCSTMTRAKETADLIVAELPAGVRVMPPSDLLREGPPAMHTPAHPTWSHSEYGLWKGSARIEAAFRAHMHRPRNDDDDNDDDKQGAKDDAKPTPGTVASKKPRVDIIVCHGNVIRYFFCRGLQLDPEAWLRIGVAHGSMTLMNISNRGTVTTRGLGLFGHMPIEKVSYS